MEFKNQESQNQEQNKPQLCVKCCQFFGNPEKEKMCSKCFNDYKASQSKKNSGQNLDIKQEIKKEEEEKINENKPLSKESQCMSCSKRVGIFGFKCKCAQFFCKAHRLPEIHNCQFNFNQDGKEKLQKNLTKCEASQLEKI